MLPTEITRRFPEILAFSAFLAVHSLQFEFLKKGCTMISKRLLSLLALSALSISSPLASGDEEKQAGSTRFAVASIRLEQTPRMDVWEVVIEAVGRSDGLTKLTVTAPNGSRIIDFNSPSKSNSDLLPKRLVLESDSSRSSLPNLRCRKLKRAYPAGEYAFEGTTTSGQQLRSRRRSSTHFQKRRPFITPKADANDVPVKNVKLEWAHVEGVTGYAIELTQGDSPCGSKRDYQRPATTFSVRKGSCYLAALYQMASFRFRPAERIVR